MKTEEFILIAEATLGNAFPDFVFRLFPDPDDDVTFFAYTFCVPDGSEQKAKDAVRGVIRSELDGAEWDVIPAIKNLTTTKAYYPQYLRSVPRRHTVPNSVVLAVVNTSRTVQEECFQFGGDDFDQMVDDQDRCKMPTHRESHEGQFDFAA